MTTISSLSGSDSLAGQRITADTFHAHPAAPNEQPVTSHAAAALAAAVNLDNAKDLDCTSEGAFWTQIEVVDSVQRVFDGSQSHSRAVMSQVSGLPARPRQCGGGDTDPTGAGTSLQLQLGQTQEELARSKQALAESQAMLERQDRVMQSMYYGLQSLKDLTINQALDNDSLRLILEGRGSEDPRFGDLAELRARRSAELERALLCLEDGTLLLTDRGDHLMSHLRDPCVLQRELPWGRQATRPAWQ